MLNTRLQDKFSFGEISPKNFSKINWDGYFSSLRKATNTIILPQSEVKRRFGTSIISPINNIKDYSQVKLFEFQIGVYSNYVMVIIPNEIQVYYEGYLCATLQTEYGDEVISELNFMQDNGVARILNPYIQPMDLVRSPSQPIDITDINSVNNTLTTPGLNMVVGQVLPVTFYTNGILPTTLPQINTNTTYFIKAISLTEFAIYGNPLSASQDINRYSVISLGSDSKIIQQNNWNLEVYEFEVYPTYDYEKNYLDLKFAFSATSRTITSYGGDLIDLTGTISVAPIGLIPNMVTGTGTKFKTELKPGYVVNTPSGDLTVASISSDTIFYSTLSTFFYSGPAQTAGPSTEIFTEEYINGVIIFPEQKFRILSINSTTEVVVDLITGGNEDSETVGSSTFIGVPAYSNLRGWPVSGTFFQSRCVFCGNFTLPNLITLSVVGNSKNFDDLDVYDTDAITANINEGQGALILFPFVSKTLTLFTTNGVYSTPYSPTSPASPTNTFFRAESNEYIQDVLPIWVDNQVLFLVGGGRIVRNIKFDIAIDSYNFEDVSTISEHLIRNPISSANLKNNPQLDVNLALFVNEDGTIACYNSLREQNVSGWTEFTTDGLFRFSSGSRGVVHFIVEREINGVTRFYLERTNFNVNTDCAKLFKFETPTSVIDGLGYLEGKEVKVIADGIRLNATVNTGSITLPFAATNVEVGLFYQPYIQTLPFAYLNSSTPMSTLFFYEKNYQRIFVDYYQSYGLIVNGDEIPQLNIATQYEAVQQTGVYITEKPPIPIDDDTGIIITQNDPYDFTIRAIGMEVNVG